MSNKVERDWITKAGLRAIVLVCIYDGRQSHRCGYVGLPVGHKLWGIKYNSEIPDVPQSLADAQTLGDKSPILMLTAGVVDGESGSRIRRSPDILFECHGGLTYSACNSVWKDKMTEYPAAGNEWWFGFDCNHCDDASIEPHPIYEFNRDGKVWQQNEVEEQCESLAAQIVKLTASLK